MTENVKDIADIREWFKDHKTEYKEYADDIKKIIWKNPDSIHFLVEYLWDGNSITIKGDIGFSIFSNNSRMSFFWLAYSHYSYLREKLVACSETVGDRMGGEWDTKVADEYIEETFEEHKTTYEEDCNEFTDEENFNFYSLKETLLSNTGSYLDFVGTVNNNYSNLCTVFGDEWYDTISDNAGFKASNRIIGQLVGLEMALKQLGMGMAEGATKHNGR